MFHVKHWLWCRWCFGRRRPRPPARLGDLASLGTASRSPPVPSGPSGALHACGAWCAGVWPSQALPPPTAPPPVIQNAQLATESPVICGYVERYTFSTRIGVTPTGTAARPRQCPPAPRPCSRRYAKSPQLLRVCGLAWNSGGAGIRSVAVGLHQVLGVGELVELIDVGLGNHDIDGREHEETPCGNVLCVNSLFDEAEDYPVCNEECANAGSVGATLRFKQEKRRTSLAAMSGA